MIAVTEEFFDSTDIAAIKTWLAQPGAGLLRRALQSEMTKLQIEASTKFLEALGHDKERFRADGDAKLREVVKLQNTLGYLERAASVEFKPFTAKVTTI
jgi:hypothetical protein